MRRVISMDVDAEICILFAGKHSHSCRKHARSARNDSRLHFINILKLKIIIQHVNWRINQTQTCQLPAAALASPPCALESIDLQKLVTHLRTTSPTIFEHTPHRPTWMCVYLNNQLNFMLCSVAWFKIEFFPIWTLSLLYHHHIVMHILPLPFWLWSKQIFQFM